MLLVRKIATFQELKSYRLPENKYALFQSIWYLETFAKHFCKQEEIILLGIFDGEEIIGYGAFEQSDRKVLLLGMKPVLSGEEVTDYGALYFKRRVKSEMLEAWRRIWEWFKENNFLSLQLDYLREDATLYMGLINGEFNFESQTIKQQEVAPYIELPATWGEYLTSLDRKDRKELKRKMNRLDMIKNFRVCSEETVEQDFEEFIRLHRLSDPQKNKFMSQEMKNFFKDLFQVKKENWETNLCFLQIEDKNVAALMTFELEDKIFAYNSGYDPEYNYYSVGLLLQAFKIKQAIRDKKIRYDFLRGKERYKYDLGAKNLKLYKVVISRQ